MKYWWIVIFHLSFLNSQRVNSLQLLLRNIIYSNYVLFQLSYDISDLKFLFDFTTFIDLGQQGNMEQ